jgi:hypothetical protein
VVDVGLSLKTAQHQAGVVPTEAKRVRDGNLDAAFARLVRYVVEVAVSIGRLVIDRRRQQPVTDCERAEDRLDSAGGTETVAGPPLC